MRIRNTSQYFDHNPIYRNTILLDCKKTINFTLFGRLKRNRFHIPGYGYRVNQ